MKCKMKTPVYNPVVKNGLFEVSVYGTTKKYRAIDAAEAKFKLQKFIGIFGLWRVIKSKQLEPTIRKYALASEKQINMKVRSVLTVGKLKQFIAKLPDDAAVNLDFDEQFIESIVELSFAKPGESPYKKGCLVIRADDMNL